MLIQRALMLDLFPDSVLELIRDYILNEYITKGRIDREGIIRLHEVDYEFVAPKTESGAKISFFSEMKNKELCSLNLQDFGNNQQHIFLLTTNPGKSRFPFSAKAAVKLTIIHEDGTLMLELIEYDYCQTDSLRFQSEITLEEYYEGGYTLGELAGRIFEIFDSVLYRKESSRWDASEEYPDLETHEVIF